MRLPVVEITVEQKLHQGTHRKTGGIPCPSGQAGFSGARPRPTGAVRAGERRSVGPARMTRSDGRGFWLLFPQKVTKKK